MTVLSTLKKGAKAYLVFAVVHVLFKILSRVRRMRKFRRMTKHLPGNRVDQLGKGFRANVHRLHDWTDEEEIGPYRSADLIKRSAPEPVVTANSGEMIKFILRDEFNSFSKPSPNADPLFRLLNQFLGKGIFVVRHGVVSPEENDIWYSQRKTASKVFTRGNFLKGMRSTFVEKGHNFLRLLEAPAAANAGVVGNAAGQAEAVDMQEKFFSFTFDSIQAIFFGRKVDSLLGDKDEFAAAFDKAHYNMVSGLFNNIFLSLLQKVVLPFPFGDLTPNTHGQNLTAFVLDRTDSNLVAFRENVAYLKRETLKRVREIRANPEASRTNMIGNFISSGNFSDEELTDLVLNLVIAGRDTTACTLSWMFYELAINPEVQAKLAEELDSVITDGRDPEAEDLTPEKTPYLNGVLYETFRLHPPVPAEMKIATEPVTFPCGTTVPEGTKVTFHPYSIGRDPVKFPNPEKFDPARWIPFEMPDPYDFPVFQAGPRLCLGRDFAIFEAKTVAAMLLQKYSFELRDGEKDKITYSLSLTMSIVNSKAKAKDSDNLWLVPRPRARHRVNDSTPGLCDLA